MIRHIQNQRIPLEYQMKLPLNLNFSGLLEAVDGKELSGVVVAKIIKSISIGSKLEKFKAFKDALVAISEVNSFLSTKCLNLIPERCCIHSSDVSTNFDKSKI